LDVPSFPLTFAIHESILHFTRPLDEQFVSPATLSNLNLQSNEATQLQFKRWLFTMERLTVRSFLAAALLCLFCFPAFGETQMNGVRLLTPSDPQFAQLCVAMFPDVARSPQFANIQSLAVIVTNTGNRPIHAYAVRWGIVSEAGRVIFKGNLVYKGRPDGFLFSGAVKALIPSESQLVTPFAYWTSLRRARHSASTGVPANLTDIVNAPLTKLATNAKEVVPTLDAVMAYDHVDFGPDALSLGMRFGAERNAQHDEGLSVMHLLNANVSEADLLSKLQFHIQMASFPAGNNIRLGVYRRARSEEAHNLLSIYQGSGREALQTAVTRLMRIRPTLISRAPNDH
jgi:hypothetical protein